jgi:uncharacterized GH25 family protein
MMRLALALIATLALTLPFAAPSAAHDAWVQTNTNVVRAGDVAHVDLMFGNHGNDHRDFKLAGKADPAASTLHVIGPDGAAHDLRPQLADQGYAEKEGYWTAPFRTGKPGLYLVAHSSDKVVSYAPKRSIKSAKTMFVASASLDRVPLQNAGYDRVLGHALELVATKNPVTPMGPGEKIKVQLLYKGKPLQVAKVSFVPRGKTLAEGFDEKYERLTDANGLAGFEPTDANYYLVVAHHEDAQDKGEGYDSTKYAATLTVIVPAICPCCGE